MPKKKSAPQLQREIAIPLDLTPCSFRIFGAKLEGALVTCSSTLQTIARLTFPAYKGDKVSIAFADEAVRRDDTRIARVAWLVDLAEIEDAGPNEANEGTGPREVLPISSGGPILPTRSAQIVARTQEKFQCNRFMISNAGTVGGAADWIVNDISIGNRSQLAQVGDIPGELFATNAIDTFIRFEGALANMDIAVVVTYIGLNETGCPFFGLMVGKRYESKPAYVHVRSDPASSTCSQIPLGFALVSQALQAGSHRRNDSPVTIHVPSIDQPTIDVAVDAVLIAGAPTEAVHKMIGNVLGDRHALVHAAYVALVEQRANELAAKEAHALSG